MIETFDAGKSTCFLQGHWDEEHVCIKLGLKEYFPNISVGFLGTAPSHW